MPAKKDLAKKLTPEQYKVTQEKGTEAPFSGCFVNFKKKGDYTCVVCGQKLFSSDSKYDSKTGWPSFFAPVDDKSLKFNKEADGRTEVVCANCRAHLGHVFNDGPAPSRQRYCINSAALGFKAKKDG